MKPFLRRLLLLLVFSALTAATCLMHRPAQWSELEDSPPKRRPPLTVIDQMRQAAIKRSAPFEVSEERLNRYLRNTTETQVDFPFGAWAEATPPQFDLIDDLIEMRLRWQWTPRWTTDLTVRMQVQRRQDRFVVEVLDGAYGQLPVPRGLLRPVRSLLEGLGEAFQAELDALFQMNDIQVLEDKLVLDPRF